MSLYDDVYGISYKAAQHKESLIISEINSHIGYEYQDIDELKTFAKDHLLDKVVYMSMQHKFYCVSHKGELLTQKDFEDYYRSILALTIRQGNRIVESVWSPTSFEYYNNAYIAAEQSDGVHKPLYYRDYFVPTGYYNEERDVFNIAKPFPVFAKNTGKDTSHLYTYIQHIAGECAMWLLAWLRAKLLYPTVKTQVVPIIISRAQGSGKTTFAEVICKGLFGKDNVIVSDQYDATARFNADYADALIVCQEEKEETDRRNPAGTLKSRATATTIRKEQKGVDPIYQESYTDFILTTNKDVPIKFEGREDQRRFMVMEADEEFTRKESSLADEIFTKLYGYDACYNKVGTPFTEDKDLIAQFKHELFVRKDIADVPLREFPKTAAYKRCFTLPRTNEATDIEAILRSLAPFIKESLLQNKVVSMLPNGTKLSDIVSVEAALQFMPAYKDYKKLIAICRPLVFLDPSTDRPYAHSTVERELTSAKGWLLLDYNLVIDYNSDSIPGGFTGIAGRYKMAPAARFYLAGDAIEKNRTKSDPNKSLYKPTDKVVVSTIKRIGQRLRVNDKFRPDPNGCYETVNEMKQGILDLKNKSQNVQYMDTFLLESDETSSINMSLEKDRAEDWLNTYGDATPIKAELLYQERLRLAKSESMRLFNEGIACRVVYSGAKSYHILIRVKCAPTSLQEYAWLHSYLCSSVSDKLTFDASTCDPARLTRSPIKLIRNTEAYGINVKGTQYLVAEDWLHIYDLEWFDLYDLWRKRPLKKIEQTTGRRVMPTKKEYQEAAEAIIDTTFWTDAKWDGRRQKCFFAAYRILRLLGYTCYDLWDTGVMTKGVEKYKHPDEISYWRSRRDANIIKQIDAQVMQYEQDIIGGSYGQS